MLCAVLMHLDLCISFYSTAIPPGFPLQGINNVLAYLNNLHLNHCQYNNVSRIWATLIFSFVVKYICLDVPRMLSPAPHKQSASTVQNTAGEMKQWPLKPSISPSS